MAWVQVAAEVHDLVPNLSDFVEQVPDGFLFEDEYRLIQVPPVSVQKKVYVLRERQLVKFLCRSIIAQMLGEGLINVFVVEMGVLAS